MPMPPDSNTNDPASFPRLSDGREDLGEGLAHPFFAPDTCVDAQSLGDSFYTHASQDNIRLGDAFANADYADRHALARSFEDPNSADDARLGNSFEEKLSSKPRHHKPLKETVEAPFRKPKNKKILFWSIAAVVILFLLILFFGWIPRHNEAKEARAQAKHQNEDPEVDVIRVSRAQSAGGLTVPGTTTPLIESSIYARANGYLKARYVDIGDHVKKGQLLAIIEAPDLDQQVDQAREQLRQAQAQLDQQITQLALTKVTVERYRALVERGVFSRQDGDQQETNYQAQRANVASAERNVEAFRANLRRVIALQSYERVTAPFTGVITQRNVDVGALIQASGTAGGNAPMSMPTGQMTGSTQQGSTNTSGSSGNAAALASPDNGGGQGGALFTIAKVDELRILVSVPEGYSSYVTPGTHATLHFQEYPDSIFYGNVDRNAGSIDQNTRTLLTQIVVDNHAGKLLSGMYAVATFAAPPGPGAIMVSGEAIAIRDDRPTIAVIDNGKVRLQPVILGRDFGSDTEILGGLKVGDIIASTFTDSVQPGQRIKAEMQKSRQAPQPATPAQGNPPGGSTQFGDPGTVDQNMQGQSAKPSQKKGGKGVTKATGKSGSQSNP
jgi:multidrug efflux pump subunit AcrA (membrane-fusion protein)